jgi:hypothetical protein
MGRGDLWDRHLSIPPCAVRWPLSQLANINLTDLADLTVLYPAQGRRSSTLTETSTMVAPKPPSAWKMLPDGFMMHNTDLVSLLFCSCREGLD